MAVTSAAMEDIMNKAEKDKRVRVIVVTGTGEKAFCAGEDLSELSSGGECMTVTDHGFGGITDRLCPKPTICAVNGVAAGGGMEIAVSCDIVVAAEHARFGLTEPKVGLIASTGGLVRMARDVPRKAGHGHAADRSPGARRRGQGDRLSSTTSCRPRSSWTRLWRSLPRSPRTPRCP